jgi:hypothetical protein
MGLSGEGFLNFPVTNILQFSDNVLGFSGNGVWFFLEVD